MSIKSIKKEDYQQELRVSQENKQLYGEIFTPFSLIDIMFDMMEPSYFSDPSKTYLDAGAGSGHFSMCLYWRLMEGLRYIIHDEETRSSHILAKMIYMSEIREENVAKLRDMFGEECNISEGNFLEYLSRRFDYIIGNPPYNCNGIKKVPTNSVKNKKQDGKTVFKYAVKGMADVSEKILKQNNLTGDDISLFIPHQANKRIIDAASKRCGIASEKVIINIDRYGNTTAGTIPIALNEAVQQNKLKNGDYILLSSFGAGFTWGSILIKWSNI